MGVGDATGELLLFKEGSDVGHCIVCLRKRVEEERLRRLYVTSEGSQLLAVSALRPRTRRGSVLEMKL